jgi:hypothetical protein
MLSFSLRISSKFSLKDFLVNYYYIFVMLFYFFSMVFPIVRPGLLAAVVMCLIIITNYKLFTFRNDIFHLIFFLYIIYNLFSIVFYIWNRVPVSVFFQEFSNSMMPVLFFFIGKSRMNEESLYKFYRIFTIAGIFCLIVGIYFLFFPNQMYFSYLKKTVSSFYIVTYLKDTRLNSFLGSTEVGSLSSLLVVFALHYIINKGLNLKYIILYSLAVLCVALSQQRSAILISAFMIIIWHIHGIKVGRINLKFIFAQLFFVILAFIWVFNMHPELVSQVTSRLSAFGSAISERSGTWFSAIRNSPNIILGTGLGSVGHKAIMYSKYFVHDGSFFKILAETGIIGLLLFSSIILMTFYRFFIIKRVFRLEISIITVLLFQAIGSNVLAFQTLLPIFWFSIGRIYQSKIYS